MTPELTSLLDEIRRMRDLITYFEGRILRKYIAVEELLSGQPCTIEAPAPASPVEAPASPVAAQASPVAAPKPERGPSVRQLILAALPALNGAAWARAEVLALFRRDHPGEVAAKVERGLYIALATMLKRGEICRVPGGFQRMIDG